VLALLREDLAEELAECVLRRRRDAQALGGAEGEHLGFLVGPEPELVGALLRQDGEEAVDAGHRKGERTATGPDSRVALFEDLTRKPSAEMLRPR
jgi:hypothetical protein